MNGRCRVSTLSLMYFFVCAVQRDVSSRLDPERVVCMLIACAIHVPVLVRKVLHKDWCTASCLRRSFCALRRKTCIYIRISKTFATTSVAAAIQRVAEATKKSGKKIRNNKGSSSGEANDRDLMWMFFVWNDRVHKTNMLHCKSISFFSLSPYFGCWAMLLPLLLLIAGKSFANHTVWWHIHSVRTVCTCCALEIVRDRETTGWQQNTTQRRKGKGTKIMEEKQEQ